MDKEYLKRCLASGMSLKEMARDVGAAPGTVGYWVRKHGLTANGSGKYDPNKALPERRIIDLAESGRSASQIAREIGVSTQAVIRRLGATTARARRIALIREAREAGRTTIELDCPRHGLTSFWVGREKVLCHRCNSKAVARRRRKVKAILICEAGGCCQICGFAGSQAALEFHHLDPSSKSFAVSQAGVTRSIAATREEAKKCILLCANCHAGVEVGDLVVPVDWRSPPQQAA